MPTPSARRPRIRGALAAAIAALLLAALPGAARAEPVVVFAAASLKEALDAAAAAWGGAPAISYAASPALARQIEEGAPADVFVSADRDWMDHLDDAGLIDAATRRDLLGNRIVLIAAGRDAAPVELAPGLDLAGLLGPDGRLAMADVEAVPAGRYGRAALETLGLWDAVADRLAQAENVRAALAFVARGEAPLGVVYATDAGVEDAVSVVGTFPADSHPPIVYPIARVAGSTNPAAEDFLAFLEGEAAGAIFARFGFEVLPAPPAPPAGG
jgi:molybdate transport system substrate-binding protein